ncbi:hypothetical protein C8F04DRAFT_1343396 [Mycena alexandri]|uniref:Uncharacterized protein n=1 Tax=Mycena alexandri TaxID=1745969 RepID=A0AAD6XE61_9AGAR|nr:hypothetical protein C8F04DRAFT_1343396 [Mycena alexandri]
MPPSLDRLPLLIMTFTLLWGDGLTWFFSSRTTIQSGVDYRARLEHQLKNNVYILRTMPSDGEPSTQVVLKIARDAGEIAALELEARFYTKELKTLQGTFVPWFYGIYHGDVDGVPVACCPATKRTGVMHCDLDNGRQFVLSGKNVKIVDFSVAVPHRCPGAMPTLHPGMGSAPTGCKELLMLEERYGIYSGESFPIVNAPIRCLAEGNPLQLLARRFGMMG